MLISRDSTWISHLLLNTEQFPLLNRIYWGEEDFLVMSYKARGQDVVLSSPFTLPSKPMSTQLPFGPSPALAGISGSNPSLCSGLHPKELKAGGH